MPLLALLGFSGQTMWSSLFVFNLMPDSMMLVGRIHFLDFSSVISDILEKKFVDGFFFFFFLCIHRNLNLEPPIRALTR